MKKISAIAIACSLTACSSVDSVQVFNQQQAAILLSHDHTMQPTRQMIKLPLANKHDWKKIDISYGTIGTPVMLIPTNETRDDWTQSYRTQIRGYRHSPGINAKKMAQQIMADAKQQCTQAAGEVIIDHPSFTEYKLKLSGCHEEQDQIQVGKAFNGSDAVYVVYYSAKTGRASNAEINKNAHAIRYAKLLKNPQP